MIDKWVHRHDGDDELGSDDVACSAITVPVPGTGT